MTYKEQIDMLKTIQSLFECSLISYEEAREMVKEILVYYMRLLYAGKKVAKK